MATTKTRVTFALDRETLRSLERLASTWGISKAEAVH